jgi:hypothetical protein
MPLSSLLTSGLELLCVCLRICCILLSRPLSGSELLCICLCISSSFLFSGLLSGSDLLLCIRKRLCKLLLLFLQLRLHCAQLRLCI